MAGKGRGGRHFLLYNLSLAAAGLLLLLYLFLLRVAGAPFLCFFSFASHLYCPGCGMTRATEALLRLDLATSLSTNPMALLLLFTLVYYEVAFFLAMRRGQRVSPWPLILFAAALLLYFVLRNLLLVFGGIDPLGDLIIYWRV